MTNFAQDAALFPMIDGFCHPRWNELSNAIEACLPEERWNEAFTQAALIWAERNRDVVGAPYGVLETDNFIILSPERPRIRKDLGRLMEQALKAIRHHLRGTPQLDKGHGKQVLFVFNDSDLYYQYLAHFYPEGEHPMSGGVYLSGEGYGHMVLPSAERDVIRNTLIHELTHACLSHLSLPMWIDEAVAMWMEDKLLGNGLHLDRELYQWHQQTWDPDTIQFFWIGAAWSLPELSELSYSLAQVLWRKIETDLDAPQELMVEFIAKAQKSDGGEAAFQELFDHSLRDLVADFLGPGEWAPRPKKWEEMLLGQIEEHEGEEPPA